MITAESLTHIPLFAFLPEDERASLARRAADVRLHQDEWLISEAGYDLIRSVQPEYISRTEILATGFKQRR